MPPTPPAIKAGRGAPKTRSTVQYLRVIFDRGEPSSRSRYVRYASNRRHASASLYQRPVRSPLSAIGQRCRPIYDPPFSSEVDRHGAHPHSPQRRGGLSSKPSPNSLSQIRRIEISPPQITAGATDHAGARRSGDRPRRRNSAPTTTPPGKALGARPLTARALSPTTTAAVRSSAANHHRQHDDRLRCGWPECRTGQDKAAALKLVAFAASPCPGD